MAKMGSKVGVLLLNLGTPLEPTPKEVGRYLKEFLMDPNVIDLPWPLRGFLVHGLIVPKRAKASALLYQKIWTSRGSPLAFHLQDLAAGVQRELPLADFLVLDGMRYGSPSIRDRFSKFHQLGIRQVLVAPLYPQYSGATTGSSIQLCEVEAKRLGLEVEFLRPFYNQTEFIEVWKNNIQRASREFRPDAVLFSFHGLPERQLLKASRAGGTCAREAGCCERLTESNSNCYRAQCVRTAELLAGAIGLSKGQFEIGFQSRLGRAKWIGPYAEELVRALAKKGKKRLLIAAPSFVADCLETLEELDLRTKEAFLQLGGEDLRVVPCPNASSDWICAVAAMVKRHQFIQ